jgi:hypothetical protein
MESKKCCTLDSSRESCFADSVSREGFDGEDESEHVQLIVLGKALKPEFEPRHEQNLLARSTGEN